MGEHPGTYICVDILDYSREYIKRGQIQAVVLRNCCPGSGRAPLGLGNGLGLECLGTPCYGLNVCVPQIHMLRLQPPLWWHLNMGPWGGD